MPKIMTGEELKKLREKYELTQEELAEALGTIGSRVSEWENGRKNMRVITQKAAKYYFMLRDAKMIN